MADVAAAGASGQQAVVPPRDVLRVLEQAVPLPGTPGWALVNRAVGRTPPPASSATEQAELRLLHEVERRRTVEGDRWAAERASTGKSIRGWIELMREGADRMGPIQAVLGAVFIGATMLATAAVTQVQKLMHGRPRPFDRDATLKPLLVRPSDRAFPSGHASAAFAAAEVVAALDPVQAAAARSMAREVAYSRVYAGLHYPSDIQAGARLGARIGGWLGVLAPVVKGATWIIPAVTGGVMAGSAPVAPAL